MFIRSTIVDTIVRVGKQQGKELQPLRDDLHLLDSGLDSLCVAIIVASLDDDLGLDPLSASDAAFPVTVGEFIRLYEAASAHAPA